jgi:hypothetical protein
VTINVFQGPNSFNNSTSRVIKCVLTVNAAGTIANTSPCSSFGVTGGGAQNTTVSGNLTLSSCNLSGTINVAGDATPVTIVGGHINGASGAGIATQGAKQVLSFTLVKN